MNSFTHSSGKNGAATTSSEPVVRYGRDERGNISVFAPEAYRPVLWVLTDQPTWGWEEILEHAKAPRQEWVTGGNLFDLVITSTELSIVDQIEDTTLAVLPLPGFITIVEGYLAELDAWYAERGISAARCFHHRSREAARKIGQYQRK